jgi:hypothetical protein
VYPLRSDVNVTFSNIIFFAADGIASDVLPTTHSPMAKARYSDHSHCESGVLMSVASARPTFNIR